MPSRLSLTVNGRPVEIESGATVAAAVALAGAPFRRSIAGQFRSALCGMGICYECRVTIDGNPHCRSCQILCRPGMNVRTDE